MKKIVCYICFLITSIQSLAQNLVPNGSFEQFIQCPTGLSQFDGYCQNWYTYTKGTPDYLNVCAAPGQAGVPVNVLGTQSAFEGKAYAGLLLRQAAGPLAERTEYIATEIKKLTKGKRYSVSMQVSLADKSQWACDGLGIYFRKAGVPENTVNRLPYTAQVSFADYGALDNDTGWTRLQGSFKADDEYDQIVIGLFADSPNMIAMPDSKNRTLAHAYYYLDSVTILLPLDSIEHVNDTGRGSLGVEVYTGDVCPNDTFSVRYFFPDTVKMGKDNEFHPVLVHSGGKIIRLPVQKGTVSGLIKWKIPDSLAAGAYQLYIVTTDPFDTTFYQGHIGIRPLPTIKVTANQPECGGEIRLDAKVTGADNVNWQGPGFNGKGVSHVIHNAGTANSGVYVVFTDDPCVVRDTVSVNLFCNRLQVPTAFSPNGDGKNDLLYLYGIKDVSEIHFRIFNRWGQLIYESNDVNAGWDGTYKGQITDLSCVAYVLDAVFKDGLKEHISGNVTIIR